jgi:hypothetical protein
MKLEAVTVLHGVINQVPPSSGHISTLKMEVAYSSEKLVGTFFIYEVPGSNLGRVIVYP